MAPKVIQFIHSLAMANAKTGKNLRWRVRTGWAINTAHQTDSSIGAILNGWNINKIAPRSIQVQRLDYEKLQPIYRFDGEKAVVVKLTAENKADGKSRAIPEYVEMDPKAIRKLLVS